MDLELFRTVHIFERKEGKKRVPSAYLIFGQRDTLNHSNTLGG